MSTGVATVFTTGTALVQPSPRTRVVTITNLDKVNGIHLREGAAISSTTEGHILSPLSNAVFMRFLGDKPNLGIWGIAENANVTIELTVR
jgi:hypothetical protein